MSDAQRDAEYDRLWSLADAGHLGAETMRQLEAWVTRSQAEQDATVRELVKRLEDEQRDEWGAT